MGNCLASAFPSLFGHQSESHRPMCDNQSDNHGDSNQPFHQRRNSENRFTRDQHRDHDKHCNRDGSDNLGVNKSRENESQRRHPRDSKKQRRNTDNRQDRDHHWPPVIGGTRTLKNARMLREFVRRSMPLLPPW